MTSPLVILKWTNHTLPCMANTGRRYRKLQISLDPEAARRILPIAGFRLPSGSVTFMSPHTPQIFFSVGEPSGDQHTARLIAAIRDRVPNARPGPAAGAGRGTTARVITVYL